MIQQINIEVWGRVQGVNYRRTVQHLANSLKLTGYVKNREDGAVLIIAQGELERLQELLEWCQRGTFFSHVEGMRYKFTPMTKKHRNFDVKIDKSLLEDEAKSLINLGKEVLGLQTRIENVPRHVAIIPNGNRRWARERGWFPWIGHQAATTDKRIFDLLTECKELGIEYISFWALSTENWLKRDKREVDEIFNLFRNKFNALRGQFAKEQIRFRHVGRKDRLPKDILEALARLEEETKDYKALNMQLLLDYGGRDELIRAINNIIKDGKKEVTEELISEYLDTKGIPDADLIIRTAGEKRMSGLYPFQAVYAEYYFTSVYFPDFTIEDFQRAIFDYSKRKRTFGSTAKEDQAKQRLSEPSSKELLSVAVQN